MDFSISKIEDWELIVEKIVPQLKHNILLLKGNLGAGKTTFTQYLLKRLGSNDEVNSPTYSLVNEYDTPNGKIFHFDLYRLNSIEEAYDMGIEEYIDNAFLCIIEWPEIYEEDLTGLDFHEMSILQTNGIREVHFE